MRITDLTFGMKKNLGNYESAELSVSAVIEVDENANDAITRLKNITEWHLNLPEREAKYLQFTNELKSETCDKREQKEKWVAHFEERKTEMEAI